MSKDEPMDDVVDNVVNLNDEKQDEDELTKFTNERQMLLDWLNDYDQRTSQVGTARERMAYLTGWFAGREESEDQ